MSGEEIEFGIGFFKEEWTKIVSAFETYTMEQYIKISRLGRGTRLDRKKRMQVWSVFDEYMQLMKEKQIRDTETAMYECCQIFRKNNESLIYSTVIVDEGQDLGMNSFRLLRLLAGEEHVNDIFIVGDAHQRIYKNRAILSKCGINIRGRSNILKINYRTTEEIRKYAFAFLKGLSFDDLDEETDDNKMCQSLTHGDKPIIRNFKTGTEEFEFICTEIQNLKENGSKMKDICIVARTHKLLDDYISQFASRGIKTFEIKRNKLDDRSFDGIRVATMHRVKGLEFEHVFVVAANSRVLPLATAINYTDAIAQEESITSERCLLYVALTRARKSAYIYSYGTSSEFL